MQTKTMWVAYIPGAYTPPALICCHPLTVFRLRAGLRPPIKPHRCWYLAGAINDLSPKLFSPGFSRDNEEAPRNSWICWPLKCLILIDYNRSNLEPFRGEYLLEDDPSAHSTSSASSLRNTMVLCGILALALFI
jgi:hypothetical protein